MRVPLTDYPYVGAIRHDLARQFREAGLEMADQQARLLVMAATGLSHADLITRSHAPIPPASAALIADYARRRLSGEPVDHILGYREFYGRKFKISKDVLTPRPETELLVGAALDSLKNIKSPRILDLGSGSGAIVISILAETPNAVGVAVDMSRPALNIARQNMQTYGLADRVTFLQGYWFEPVSGDFDVILSNPPYITDAAMNALDPEVVDYDPDLALRGGADGLDAYRMIIGQAHTFLKPESPLILEIGYDQGEAVSGLLRDAHFHDIILSQDLAGHNRVIKAVI